MDFVPPYSPILRGQALLLAPPHETDFEPRELSPHARTQRIPFTTSVSFAEFAYKLLFSFPQLTTTDSTLIYITYALLPLPTQERLCTSLLLSGVTWSQFCTAYASISCESSTLDQTHLATLVQKALRRIKARDEPAAHAALAMTRLHAAISVSFIQPSYLQELLELRQFHREHSQDHENIYVQQALFHHNIDLLDAEYANIDDLRHHFEQQTLDDKARITTLQDELEALRIETVERTAQTNTQLTGLHQELEDARLTRQAAESVSSLYQHVNLSIFEHVQRTHELLSELNEQVVALDAIPCNPTAQLDCQAQWLVLSDLFADFRRTLDQTASQQLPSPPSSRDDGELKYISN